MKLKENGNELNKLVSSALMPFGIFKSPRGNDRGVPIIEYKYRILNLPFPNVYNLEVPSP